MKLTLEQITQILFCFQQEDDDFPNYIDPIAKSDKPTNRIMKADYG